MRFEYQYIFVHKVHCEPITSFLSSERQCWDTKNFELGMLINIQKENFKINQETPDLGTTDVELMVNNCIPNDVKSKYERKQKYTQQHMVRSRTNLPPIQQVQKRNVQTYIENSFDGIKLEHLKFRHILVFKKWKKTLFIVVSNDNIVGGCTLIHVSACLYLKVKH